MEIIAAWLVCAICSYVLWFSRMNKVAMKWGGIVAFMFLYVTKDDKEFHLCPHHLFSAMFKTIVLIACLIGWPYSLFCVAKSYLGDAEKQLQKELDQGSVT